MAFNLSNSFSNTMSRKLAGIALVAVLGLAALATPAMAYGNSRGQSAGGMLPPVGMLIFCQSHGSQCAASSVGKVDLTDAVLAKLQTTNTRVNNAIRPRNDVGRDVWSVGVSSGDCEDYALTKRQALIRSGIPAGALRIATTTTRRGEGHAILVVKTSRGDLVLDNLRADVRTLGGSGYHINMIATANPRVWARG